jgi:hypothetical protein
MRGMLPNTKYAKLLPNEKRPATLHGYKDATTEKPEGNYGIVLDDMYVLVDFDVDHPQREAIEKSLPPTWSQRTQRTKAVGTHYLYLLPEGFKGTDCDIITPDGTVIGDIKFKGYLVGPGSIVDGNPYKKLNDLDPMPILPTSLKSLYGPPKPPKTHSVVSNPEAKTAEGGRNKMLTSRAGTYRRQGASPAELEAMLLVANQELCDPPLPTREVINIAQSVSRYNPENEPSIGLWPRASDLPLNQPNIEWVLFRFIAENKLNLQYGDCGIGKSTWVAWLARKLLREGKKVGFSATEESFSHFSNGVRLGMDKHEVHLLKNLADIGKDWTFPGDGDTLRKGLEQDHLDFIYFDSIYDIFDSRGQGIYTNTRQIFKPLTILAEEMRVTIFGTFHENKSREDNGSKEMSNIPRVLSRAIKETKYDGRLRLHVQKTNYKKPDKDLLFFGEWVKEENPDGTIIQEKNEEGKWEDSLIYIVKGHDSIERISDEGTVNERDIQTNSSNDEAYWKVYNCLQEHPTWGRIRIAKELDISERIVQKRLENIENNE